MRLPHYLVTASEMRALDTAAIEEYGIPGMVLMENAGRSTFEIVRRYVDRSLMGLKVSVICGPGNNGGDGYVVARYLLNHGADVRTFLLSSREKIKGDALTNLKTLEKMTEKITIVNDAESLANASTIWRNSKVMVDAILGTGLNSDVRSPYKDAILEINRAPGLRVAVDLPSGLDADTGRILGVAIKADLTATYGFRKLGMALHPGCELCGTVEVVDISIPLPAVERTPPKGIYYDLPLEESYLQPRNNLESHKGTFGHVLIVGGSPGKTGAPVLAARAASRIGAGLVTVGAPASLHSILEAKLTEEMTEPLPESCIKGYLGEASADRVLSLAKGKRCLVLGPGLSTHEGTQELVRMVVLSFNGWIVLDADGLNSLVPHIDDLKHTRSAGIILTPHPGEMARLSGKTTSEVQGNRIFVAREMACKYGVWIVLKGSRTITAAPDGRIFVNATGNPWMASGGQGDVLSGILGGLMAQALSPDNAIPLGVYVHGRAADEVIERRGPRPVLAGDTIDQLPDTISRLHKGMAPDHGAPAQA